MLAIAEFGSVSRSTSDAYSDRDLLVVCPRKQQYRLHERYKKMGYSVSVLSDKQLLHMKQRGSMFIQHLRREARIMIDANGALGQFLESCELVPPSSRELFKCRSTLGFVSSWPESMRLSAWKSDFLFCVSRDFLIKMLASKGVIAFGLEDLEGEIHKHFGVTESEFSSLHILRRSKTAYRSGSELPSSTMEAIDSWLNTMSRRFGIKLSRAENRLTDRDIMNLPNRSFNSPYERLRSLEAAYLIARGDSIFHPEHDLLMKHIVSPSLYGSSQIRKEEIIRKYLDEVVNLMANKSIQTTDCPLRFVSLQMNAAV